MKTDLTLMHPPSIYDFRKRDVVAGPISELVPSTGVFEMYPIGFLAIMSHLTSRGYRVRIDNIALKMLNSTRYEFNEEILKLDTDYVGLDLHWLPHVHGAINLARIIKEFRPDIKVIMGGLSATYYAGEIMRGVKAVDIVVRGDASEIPIEQILEGKKLEDVPNIIYRQNSRIVDNGFTFSPKDLDYQTYDYSQIIRSSIRNFDVLGHLPYCDWTKQPVAMVLTTHGCAYSCAICGGSYYAFKNSYGRSGPIFRSSKKIVEDIMNINNQLHIPVFVVGDILLRPEKDRDYIFSQLRREGIDIPLLFEVFIPHKMEDLQKMVSVTHDVSMEISPDSSNEKIRFRNGRPYGNKGLEKFVQDFLALGGKKIDVYFLIGLTEQRREDALKDVDYSRKLMKMNNNDERLFVFTSPVSPFLDPGSRGFENPELGYKLRFRTLMEHYNALENGRTWADFLNYETKWMSREEIVNTTYDAIDKLLYVKKEIGYIDSEELENSHQILETSRLAVNLSAKGDYGMLKSGEALMKSCGTKYTILKKEIMWGSGGGKMKKMIFMVYKYLQSSRE